jgi:leucine dehydrogenase
LVQGTGNVGENLVKHLTEEGAKVYVTDINEEKLKEVAAKFKAEVVEPDACYDLDIDIYAPCALGATINDNTLSRLKCSIVAGAANNQLAEELVHGKAIMDKGILWAPDFLINAGGLINVYSELHGYNRDRAMNNASKIYDTTLSILRSSKAENIPTIVAAKRIAEKRIQEMGKVKLSY